MATHNRGRHEKRPDMVTRQILAEKLRKLILQSTLSRQQLAEKAGVSYSMIYNIVNGGCPTMDALEKIHASF